MTKSTPRKRATRTTGSTGTRKRVAARSPATKTAARKQAAATKKALAAAGESKAARKPPEPNEETLTLADYSAEIQSAVRAAAAKKAERITVLDLRHTSAFTDVFVLATGQNARQVKAIVDNVEETLRATHGQRPVATEGYRNSEWVLVDYFDFVVHVFTPESREFYALERLWGSAIRVEVSDEAASRPA
jgi:ribosome-associated protein